MNERDAIEFLRARESAEDAYTNYGEIWAEYTGECHAYGDAWPGAVASVEGAKLRAEDAAEYVEKLEAMFGLFHTPKSTAEIIDEYLEDGYMPF